MPPDIFLKASGLYAYVKNISLKYDRCLAVGGQANSLGT